jgi:hypothetical protein
MIIKTEEKRNECVFECYVSEFICSKCKYKLGDIKRYPMVIKKEEDVTITNNVNEDWKFCPHCGEPLY